MHRANLSSWSCSLPEPALALLLGLLVEPLAEAMPLLPSLPRQPTNPTVNSRATIHTLARNDLLL
jgi:hypothetical protein